MNPIHGQAIMLLCHRGTELCHNYVTSPRGVHHSVSIVNDSL